MILWGGSLAVGPIAKCILLCPARSGPLRLRQAPPPSSCRTALGTCAGPLCPCLSPPPPTAFHHERKTLTLTTSPEKAPSVLSPGGLPSLPTWPCKAVEMMREMGQEDRGRLFSPSQHHSQGAGTKGSVGRARVERPFFFTQHANGQWNCLSQNVVMASRLDAVPTFHDWRVHTTLLMLHVCDIFKGPPSKEMVFGKLSRCSHKPSAAATETYMQRK